MVFLKSLGQKYFSIPSDGDETGAVAVVPISGSDDVLSSKQYTQKSKRFSKAIAKNTMKAKCSEAP